MADERAPWSDAEAAIGWLASHGAHPWLVRHHELVVEAAEALVVRLAEVGVALDRSQVLVGAAIHDAGKIEHPTEMHAPGHAHEAAGEAMLLAAGFPPHLARCCVTHASWSEPRAVLEDRLVALADELWKGKRDEALERALLDELAAKLRKPAWEVFERFDAICEVVAHSAPDRLARSRVE